MFIKNLKNLIDFNIKWKRVIKISGLPKKKKLRRRIKSKMLMKFLKMFIDFVLKSLYFGSVACLLSGSMACLMFRSMACLMFRSMACLMFRSMACLLCGYPAGGLASLAMVGRT